MTERPVERFLGAVRQLDVSAYRAGRATADLVMARSGELSVEYAPFDYVEQSAELVVVGLTPGRTQAANALASLSDDLRAGRDLASALQEAKRVASFSGPMRGNLVAMLDEVGVPEVFGRRTAAQFFTSGEGLVHFTSALRYPVYLAGRNYSGSPGPLAQPMLRTLIDTFLAEEAAILRRAIWVPLGGHAEAALLHLAGAGRLDRSKVLAGLPHPSGANAERIAYFLGRKARRDLSAKTNATRIDQSKRRLVEQLLGLRR